ncbi:O-antigen/teichoic acid export membrane protein [Rhodobacteraceae bacterium MBR-64]|jgi:O-antigen/teichoic acid export membrane protein
MHEFPASPPQGSTVSRIYSALGLVMGGKAGAGVLSLIYLMISARTLGPVDFGVLVLVHGYVVMVVGIVEFPAWQAIIRYGAEAERDAQPHRLARLLRFSAVVELSAGALAVAVAAVLAPMAGPVLGWSDAALALAVPYSIAALGSVRSTPAGYLQLIGRFDLIGAHNMVAPGVRLIGAMIVALAGWGLKGFLIAWMVAAVAEFAVLWGLGLWLAYRHLGRTLIRPEAGRVTRDNRDIWRFLIANNVDVTLGELAGRAAPLIVGGILGAGAAGLFSVAHRATMIIAQPAQMLGNTAYAELARLVSAGDGGRPLRRALVKVTVLALLASLPVVAIVALVPGVVVRLLAGDAFQGAATLMVWLMVGRAILMVVPPCRSALSALGRPGVSLSVNLVASLVFLSALPVLLQLFGLVGAGIQAVLQALAVSVALAVLTARISRAQDQ